MKKYYKLSDGETGKPQQAYTNEQPGLKDLVYLDEPTGSTLAIWDGTQWVDDVDGYKDQMIEKARIFFYTNWVDSSKQVAPIKAQYEILKSGTYADFDEVDQAYNDFVIFMDLE